MKNVLIVTAMLSVGASVVEAQNVNADSMSESISASGVVVEGSRIPNNTPGLGGLIGSAGNCYPGAGVQGVGPGWGFGVGGGRVDPECNVRMEMQALAALAGNSVALAHACREDESMRGTLISVGLCKVEQRPTPRPTVSARNSEVAPFTKCEYNSADNTISVLPRRGHNGATLEEAVAACKSRLGF